MTDEIILRQLAQEDYKFKKRSELTPSKSEWHKKIMLESKFDILFKSGNI